MSKIRFVAHILNFIFLIILTGAVIGFISFLNAYGFFLALVTAFIAFGVLKHNRWAYFAAAAWSLACYQLAKQGYEFQAIKHQVMTLGFVLIPVAVFLHETLGKKSEKNAQTSGIEETDKKNMPD